MAIIRDREEVIIRLCAMTRKVSELSGRFPQHPADCFCSNAHGAISFEFDEEILNWLDRKIDDLVVTREAAIKQLEEERAAAVQNDLNGLTDEERDKLLRLAVSLLVDAKRFVW